MMNKFVSDTPKEEVESADLTLINSDFEHEELDLRLKNATDKQLEKIAKDHAEVMRKIALWEFYSFVDFCSRNFGIRLAKKKYENRLVTVFKLPEFAISYFPIALSRELSRSISPTETATALYDPEIGCVIPFFSLLKWKEITVNPETGELTFYENHKSGVIFSVAVVDDESARQLVSTGKVVLGLFKNEQVIASQNDVPISFEKV